MSSKPTIIVWSLLLSVTSLGLAQDSPRKAQISSSDTKKSFEVVCNAQPGTSSNSTLLSDPSIEKESWVVCIRTQGGFSGQEKENIEINSEGDLTFRQTGKASERKISGKELELLSQTVTSAKPTGPLDQTFSMCSDCFTTTFTLHRYRSASEVETYYFSWDVTTYTKVPQEIRQIYEDILKLR